MKMKTRADLQGIRGVAIWSVLLYHFFPNCFQNGYIGVDQFLVLSGFLMAETLSCETNLSFPVILGFYYRRLRRILPLYSLFIFATLLISIIMFPHTTFTYNISYALRSLAFISNTKLGGQMPTYEEQLSNAEGLYTHTWSLSCELQFYLIAPFLIVPEDLIPKQSRLLLVFTTSYFLFEFLWLTGERELAFNSMFTRMWQFCLGALCSHSIHTKKVSEKQLAEYRPQSTGNLKIKLDFPTNCKSSVLSHVSNFTCFSLILFSWFPVEITTHFVRTFVSFNTACLIYIGRKAPSGLLSNRLLVYLGDISYSLYLIHWPIYVYLKQSHQGSVGVSASMVGIAGSLVLAVVVHEVFEKFYLKLGITAIICMTCALYFLCAATLVTQYPNSPFYLRKKVTIAHPYLEIPKNLTVDIVTDLNINFTIMDIPLMTMAECSYRRIQSNASPPWEHICTVNNTKFTGAKRILLLGNSYAANIARMFIRLKECQQKASDIFLFATPRCEVLDAPLRGSACLNKTEEFQEVIEILKPDVLFITTRHITSMMPSSGSVDNIFEHEKQMLKRIENNVKEKVFILDALPSPVTWKYDELINDGLKTGKRVSQDSLIDHSVNRQYLLARKRMKRLAEECLTC